MAKHFFGTTAATELWIRSEISRSDPDTLCPSCNRAMKEVREPQWLGQSRVWICRSCHFFWIDPDTHAEVPHPDDLLVPQGDGTLIKDRGRAMGDFLVLSAKAKADSEDPRIENPEFPLSLAGFLGLPIEYSTRAIKIWPIITYLLIAAILFIHVFYTTESASFIRDYGFIPGDPFRDFGRSLLVAPLIHGDWIHLLGNAYFFAVFADDVEDRLGKFGFLCFIISASVVTALGTLLMTGSPKLPHIGLSGIVTGTLVFYALTFPKQRIVYLLPGFHYLGVTRGEAIRSAFITMRWIALPAIVVIPGYVVADLVRWYFFERQGLTHIAHSAHLGGAAFGFLAWAIVQTLSSQPKQTVPTVR